jgi:hypothetical protein
VSGHQLWLIAIPHNERPYTANVFTLNKDLLDDHHDLAIIMRKCPSTFIMVRGSHIDEVMHRIIDY